MISIMTEREVTFMKLWSLQQEDNSKFKVLGSCNVLTMDHWVGGIDNLM